MAQKNSDDKLQDELVDKYQKETMKIYEALLIAITPLLSMRLIKKLNKKIDIELDRAGKKQDKIITELLIIAGLTKIRDRRIIKKIINDNWSGERFSDRIYKEKKLLKKVLKKELRNALINKESKEDIIRRVSKKLDISINNAKRLIDTEITNVIAKSNLEKGKGRGHTQYKYIAILDDRTSDECREMNGEVFSIKEAKSGVNLPPLHPHCRSRIKTF